MQIDQEIKKEVENVEQCRLKYKETEAKLLLNTTDTEMGVLLGEFKSQHNDLRQGRQALKNSYQKRIEVSPYEKR